MTTSIVECPHCHYRFNYEFIPGASFTSIRLGTRRIFKCPNCKELAEFDLNHSGADPSLPTHGDSAETSVGAKRLALIIGPLIVLTAVGIILLPILGAYQGLLVLVIALAIGSAWIAVYFVHLYRVARRSRGEGAREAGR